ncbi:MAG: HNH endonuclease [Planctomycetales bacterium]|nr:HNH endonuclease [Planctomycetales bacterium]
MQQPHPNPALAASVLVLNRGYMAVHIVNVRRAFGLLYRALAEVLDVDEGQFANYDFATWLEISELRAEERKAEDDWISSVSFDVQVPRVIRLTRFDRVPKHTLRFNRRNLFARDNNSCQYCGTNLPSSQLSMDHVMPRSRGGETSWENVVCCCVSCNSRKGNHTPHEAKMRLLRQPKRPRQSPLLAAKLKNPKYATWRTFLGSSTMDVA